MKLLRHKTKYRTESKFLHKNLIKNVNFYFYYDFNIDY